MLTINVDSANVTCTTASVPRQLLTTKLFTMHLPMVGFKPGGKCNWKRPTGHRRGSLANIQKKVQKL